MKRKISRCRLVGKREAHKNAVHLHDKKGPKDFLCVYVSVTPGENHKCDLRVFWEGDVENLNEEVFVFAVAHSNVVVSAGNERMTISGSYVLSYSSYYITAKSLLQKTIIS